MRSMKIFLVVLAIGLLPLAASAQRPTTTLDTVVDRVISQEQAEMTAMRAYSPLVETYIQNLRPDKDLGTVPSGDRYFLGRAELAKGVELQPLSGDAAGIKHKLLGGMGSVFTLLGWSICRAGSCR